MVLEKISSGVAEGVPPLSKGEAIVAVEALRNMIMLTGAIDSDNDRINYIVLRLKNGRITPLEAANTSNLY